MDVIWHRLGSWAFALAPSENDHIGPQVAYKIRKQIRGRAARGCALEWNYVETAVQQTEEPFRGGRADWFPRLSWL